MRAAPDLPNHMTPAWFRAAAIETRGKATGIVPDNAMKCYSIDALLVCAEIYERIADGEWTFEGLSAEMFARQKALTHLYGVDP